MRSGGVLVASKSNLKAKNIKTLSNAIAWQIVYKDNTPIHIVGVYLQPQHVSKSEESIVRLENLIWQIKNRDRSAKIVVAGDFN